MALQNRSTIGAIVEETTEGTPVAPTSATNDYIALQEGFTMEPSFEVLESAEMTGSLGKAKNIIGAESPTASIQHYLKGSGTVATEPNFGLLLEALLGTKSIAAAEYNTVAGSTAGDSSSAATIAVDTGEGATFERGEALLIKDTDYRVRNVLSVSGDTLTAAFNLASAPGTGVNLGRSVLYRPASANHKTLSCWYYRGNGGFTELMAGARPVSAAITANAGELINCDFSLEGVGYYFDAIEITSSDTYIDFTSDNGTFAATVTAKFYKDPHALADAIKVAMETADSAETYLVTYSDSTGKYTIASSTSAVLSLLFSTGTNVANSIADKIAFAATDLTGATTYTSDSVLSFAAPQTPTYETTSPLVAKNNEVLIGDFDDYACFQAKELAINVGGTKADLLSICAESGKSGSLIVEREVSVDVVFRINQYDADKFKRFRENLNTQFAATFGEKSGGQWVEGKTVNVFMPTSTVTSLAVQETDGVLEYAMTLTGYVADGLGEFYINFL